jgi:hypothetical protein
VKNALKVMSKLTRTTRESVPTEHFLGIAGHWRIRPKMRDSTDAIPQETTDTEESDGTSYEPEQ